MAADLSMWGSGCGFGEVCGLSGNRLSGGEVALAVIFTIGCVVDSGSGFGEVCGLSGGRLCLL